MHALSSIVMCQGNALLSATYFDLKNLWAVVVDRGWGEDGLDPLG
jgi:hypothetical protein